MWLWLWPITAGMRYTKSWIERQYSSRTEERWITANRQPIRCARQSRRYGDECDETIFAYFYFIQNLNCAPNIESTGAKRCFDRGSTTEGQDLIYSLRSTADPLSRLRQLADLRDGVLVAWIVVDHVIQMTHWNRANQKPFCKLLRRLVRDDVKRTTDNGLVPLLLRLDKIIPSVSSKRKPEIAETVGKHRCLDGVPTAALRCRGQLAARCGLSEINRVGVSNLPAFFDKVRKQLDRLENVLRKSLTWSLSRRASEGCL